jgi:hypothetical protein
MCPPGGEWSIRHDRPRVPLLSREAQLLAVVFSAGHRCVGYFVIWRRRLVPQSTVILAIHICLDLFSFICRPLYALSRLLSPIQVASTLSRFAREVPT